MRRLRTYIFLPWRRKLLLGEAMALLLWSWVLVRLVAFRKYSNRLGTPRSGEHPTDALEDPAVLKNVRWSIDAVNRSFGGRFTCLMQGMAGKVMLNRRGVANTLVLGAKLNRGEDATASEAMAAHAWLWAGQVIILGGEARDGFVPVTSYHTG